MFRPNELNLIFDELYSQSARVKEEHRRRPIDNDLNDNGVILVQQHYGETNSRPYYFNRLTIKTDDEKFSKKFN